MIEEYWGLHFNPFAEPAETPWYFESPMHDEALSRMYYVIEQRHRCGILVGDEGVGKSFLLRLLRKQASRTQRQVVFFDVTGKAGSEVLADLLGELGMGDQTKRLREELWRSITDYMTSSAISRQQLVFLFDHLARATPEGQHCIERVLQHSSCHETQLTSIFTCRPDELSVLPSGIIGLADLKIRLEPLDGFNTAEYVSTGLRYAGAQRTLFSPATMHHLFDAAQGVPRAVNALCRQALLQGMESEAEQITPDLLSGSLREREESSSAEPADPGGVATKRKKKGRNRRSK